MQSDEARRQRGHAPLRGLVPKAASVLKRRDATSMTLLSRRRAQPIVRGTLVGARHRIAETAIARVFMGILLVRASLDPILGEGRIEFIGGSISPGAAFNVIIPGITIAMALRRPRAVTWLDAAPWLLLLGLCGVLSIGSPDLGQSLRILLVLVTYACVCMLPILLARTAADVRRLLDVVLLSATVPCAVGLVQIAANMGDAEYRVHATFTHANIFAFYIVAMLAVVLIRLEDALYCDGAWRRRALIVCVFVLGAELFMTKTRSAWFAAALLIASHAVLINRRYLPAMLLLAIAAVAVPGVRERLMDATSAAEYIGNGVVLNSFEWRRQLWSDAWPWIMDAPLLGNGGLGTFFHYSSRFFSIGQEPVYAHSVYVQLGFEVGLLGPVIFFGLLSHTACRVFLRYRAQQPAAAIIATTLCVAYLAVAYSDNMLGYLSFNWYFFTIIGCLVALTRMRHAAMIGVGSGR